MHVRTIHSALMLTAAEMTSASPTQHAKAAAIVFRACVPAAEALTPCPNARHGALAYVSLFRGGQWHTTEPLILSGSLVHKRRLWLSMSPWPPMRDVAFQRSALRGAHGRALPRPNVVQPRLVEAQRFRRSLLQAEAADALLLRRRPCACTRQRIDISTSPGLSPARTTCASRSDEDLCDTMPDA